MKVEEVKRKEGRSEENKEKPKGKYNITAKSGQRFSTYVIIVRIVRPSRKGQRERERVGKVEALLSIAPNKVRKKKGRNSES